MSRDGIIQGGGVVFMEALLGVAMLGDASKIGESEFSTENVLKVKKNSLKGKRCE